MSEQSARIEQALERLKADMEAAECHGILTGMLVAMGQFDEAGFFSLLAPVSDPADMLAQESRQTLKQLAEETMNELSATDCDFNPMLPEEDESLDERLHALSSWAQGFLLGLSKAGIENYDKLPEEVAEFARDMVEMSQVTSLELEEDAEENEASYFELVEYTRTGILLVNEIMNPTRAAPITEQPTLH